MRTRSILLAATIAAVRAAAAQGADNAAKPTFTFERAISVDSAGWHRLSLDATVLSGGSPFQIVSRDPDGDHPVAGGGLNDLRLYDATGTEVPYLFVVPPQRDEPLVPARLLPVPATKTTSGFEVDLGSTRRIDLLQVIGLGAPYLKRLRLDGSGDRTHWTVIIPQGTLFDLPREGLSLRALAFDPGEFRYLRVIWDDSTGMRMPLPSQVMVRPAPVGVAPRAQPLTIPVAFERRPSEPGRSRYVLRLPGARLPVAAIRLSVSDSNVLRTAKVSEARLTGSDVAPAQLGSAMLRRAARGAVVASSLDIPIEQPAEARLELTVDDGDNPPLGITAVTAVFAELPYLFFGTSGAAPLDARYGAASLPAPRYDLEAMRDSAWALPTTAAHWGDVTRLQPADAAAAMEGIPSGGAPIDVDGFRYARTIHDTVAGIGTLRLDAAVLAHSRLDDIRIVDATGKQVPYLLEHLDGPLADALPALVKIPPTAPSGARGTFTTAYRLLLPYDSLPDARLVLRTTKRVFQRRIRVEIPAAESRRRDGAPAVIASATWAHADPDAPAPALTIALPLLGKDEAQIIIDEGDNEPLSLDRPTLLLPGYELRFPTDGTGALRLLYGRRDLGAPSYDLALLGPRLVGVSAFDAGVDAEGKAMDGGATTMPGKIFWGVLIAAVVVMLVIVSRLVRQGAPTGDRTV